MFAVAFTLISLLVGVFSVTQSTPTSVDRASIPPVVWELIGLAKSGDSAVEIREPSRYTLQFLPGGEIAVVADCNQGTGTYTEEDGTITISLTATTLVLCPADSQGEVFQALLEGVTNAEFDTDGSLVLNGDGGTLRLRPALTGVVWEWQQFRGGDDTVIRPDHPERYTLVFLPGGKLAIQADCNFATGMYKADDPRLDLSVGGVTRVKCPDGSLMEQFLRDMDDVSSYVLREGQLYLALRLDSGISTFQARPLEHAAATPAAS